MRHAYLRCSGYGCSISIHAPLAGCDDNESEMYYYRNISIHAPLAGCDHSERIRDVLVLLFQSTHPLRDATRYASAGLAVSGAFQSTHPLRDATNSAVYTRDFRIFQSTHPLRDATVVGFTLSMLTMTFQSTHPLRDATVSGSVIRCGRSNFNPRTPCGMRRRILPINILIYPRKW